MHANEKRLNKYFTQPDLTHEFKGWPEWEQCHYTIRARTNPAFMMPPAPKGPIAIHTWLFSGEDTELTPEQRKTVKEIIDTYRKSVLGTTGKYILCITTGTGNGAAAHARGPGNISCTGATDGQGRPKTTQFPETCAWIDSNKGGVISVTIISARDKNQAETFVKSLRTSATTSNYLYSKRLLGGLSGRWLPIKYNKGLIYLTPYLNGGFSSICGEMLRKAISLIQHPGTLALSCGWATPGNQTVCPTVYPDSGPVKLAYKETYCIHNIRCLWSKNTTGTFLWNAHILWGTLPTKKRELESILGRIEINKGKYTNTHGDRQFGGGTDAYWEYSQIHACANCNAPVTGKGNTDTIKHLEQSLIKLTDKELGALIGEHSWVHRKVFPAWGQFTTAKTERVTLCKACINKEGVTNTCSICNHGYLIWASPEIGMPKVCPECSRSFRFCDNCKSIQSFSLAYTYPVGYSCSRCLYIMEYCQASQAQTSPKCKGVIFAESRAKAPMHILFALDKDTKNTTPDHDTTLITSHNTHIKTLNICEECLPLQTPAVDKFKCGLCKRYHGIVPKVQNSEIKVFPRTLAVIDGIRRPLCSTSKRCTETNSVILSGLSCASCNAFIYSTGKSTIQVLKGRVHCPQCAKEKHDESKDNTKVQSAS